jgi:hypothetical protein
VNPITQAISAAHAIAARAAAGGTLDKQTVVWGVSDIEEPFPALDTPLDELTGDELTVLALAADVLSHRARLIATARHNAATSAEIAALRKNRK